MSLVTESTSTLDQALAHASRLLSIDPVLAGEHAIEILKVVASHPMALLVLGASCSAIGKTDQALEILGRLSADQPDWAMAQLELGRALGRAGRGQEALVSLRHAVVLKPDLPHAWLALASQLYAMGDTDGANAAYASHIQISSQDPELLAASSALAENRIPEAEALLRARLQQTPTDVVVIRMLAEAAARLGRDDEAELLLTRCLELAPGFHGARLNYALVLNRVGKHAQALAEVESLLATEPEHPGYRSLKAGILRKIGHYTPAIDIYGRLLVEYPGNTRIWINYGNALKAAGFQEQAIEAYRKSIALDPGCGESYWNLANLKTFRFDTDELQALRTQLQRSDLDIEHQINFQFATGKALEDAGEYAQSFQHYARGNALRRERAPYDANENSGQLQRARHVYTRDFFRQRAGFGSAVRDPIFIVGLPRAGSTLIEQILSSHSAVEATMELPEISRLVHSLQQRVGARLTMTYHEVLANLDVQEVRELGEAYLERTRIHRKTDAPYFIDKMPNNFAYIGLIHLALPNARIIDARRHPLACCLSAFKQHFARGQNFAYNLDDLGRYYHDYVELMAHFDDVLPGRIHRILYEDMVDDTETEVRRLLAYCGLSFEEECLRFFENARPVSTASSEQVRQPIYRDGIDQWRHFEAWLGPLKDALGQVLDAYPAVPEFPIVFAHSG